ncbi:MULTISPECIES: urease accessory protein UreE [unclassified Helicobacter]|uniref:urease accessory protein UreE n=1 Tax=unclassified Helicobacter TaxID=2593540 RepID=UPI000CF0B52E|nr:MULTISPECIES: urease accessory protein UreE [unclassified Helicobacter]
MLIERILGNIKEQKDTKKVSIDIVWIEWYETRKKIARLRTSQGREIAMRLTDIPKSGINDGDILYRDEDFMIIISIRPVKVLYIFLQDVVDVAKVTYEIGNRHMPLFFGDNPMELQTPLEFPLQVLLDKLAIQYSIKESVLDSKNRLNVSMPHSEIKSKLELSKNFEVKITKKA